MITLSSRRPGRRGSLALALSVSVLAGCQESAAPGNEAAAGNAAGAQTAVANPCGTYAPVLQAERLPEQTGQNEIEQNCTAWRTFIALNWKADPAKPGYPDPNADPASFGTPGDMSAKVWESYLEASGVFDTSAPLKGLWQAKRPAVRTLARTSKFGSLDLTSITQAGSGNHWLTNQRGDVTYYEILMNQDEYEFISHNALTTAAGQLACATQPGQKVNGTLRGGFNMPSGPQDGWDDTDCKGNITNYGQGVGAIEIKAAWTPLPADGSLNYRYKTAIAEIRDPTTRSTRTVTVGLVGLHIIRKRFPHLPWIWATFEHIDNTPDEAANGGFSPPVLPPNPNRRTSPGYTFFNPTCKPASDPAYRCVHNAPPTPCLLGSTQCQPYNAPMQITRINPVGASANSVTAYAWSLLPARSVFNYYRLINVQWPTGRLVVPQPGQRVPLSMGDPMPKGRAGGPGQIVANTTLESFQQKSNSCMDCHANFASIVMPGQTRGRDGLRRVSATAQDAPAPYGADYSFIFLSETKR
ncbi:MAG TPA: hypothetical protein VFZ91_15365 [Allosphingosinicella sp.]